MVALYGLVSGRRYILLPRSRANTRTIRIGRLGTLQVRRGWYVCVGSAFGPGGLRIRHHARRAARPHCHIDYLRRAARLGAVWYVCGVRCERLWAAAIGAMPDAAVVMPGF